MRATPDPTSSNIHPGLRRSAVALILGQLTPLMEQEVNWIDVTRKRIKDRMSDAKHIMFNNEIKLRVIEGQLEKGVAITKDAPSIKTLIQQHQMLTDKNQELGRIADICCTALSLLDRQVKATPALRNTVAKRSKSADEVKMHPVSPKPKQVEESATA